MNRHLFPFISYLFTFISHLFTFDQPFIYFWSFVCLLFCVFQLFVYFCIIVCLLSYLLLKMQLFLSFVSFAKKLVFLRPLKISSARKPSILSLHWNHEMQKCTICFKKFNTRALNWTIQIITEVRAWEDFIKITVRLTESDWLSNCVLFIVCIAVLWCCQMPRKREILQYIHEYNCYCTTLMHCCRLQ